MLHGKLSGLGLLMAASLGALVGCGTPEEATVTLRAVDGSGQAIPNALFAIEVGGIYIKPDDPSKGNPSYQLGALTDANGEATFIMPTDLYGFHTYVAGHYYGSFLDDHEEEGMVIDVNTFAFADGETVPLYSDFVLEPSTVEPGGTVTVSVNATRGLEEDPLSEEIILILPDMRRSIAMDPPSPGMPGIEYPDGIYTTTFTAPTEPGTYDIWLTVTSEKCVTAPPTSLQLVVE